MDFWVKNVHQSGPLAALSGFSGLFMGYVSLTQELLAKFRENESALPRHAIGNQLIKSKLCFFVKGQSLSLID